MDLSYACREHIHSFKDKVMGSNSPVFQGSELRFPYFEEVSSGEPMLQSFSGGPWIPDQEKDVGTKSKLIVDVRQSLDT